MNKNSKFSVLGCGNGGKALAAQIASKGYSVNIFEALDPTPDFLKLQKGKFLSNSGDVNCEGKLNMVTNDIKEAVAGVDNIMIVVPAFAHENMIKLLIPHLEDGQNIVVFPGNYSTFLFKKYLKEAGVKKDISISEVASLPFACRAVEFDKVMIYKQKLMVKVASCPVSKNEEIVAMMNDIAPIYSTADSVLEVALDNFNAILHPLPVLLNIAGIEKNGKDFRHYIDGVSPLISKKMEEMDVERMELGKKLNLNLVSTMEQEKVYYGENDTTTLYDYFNSDESPYKEIYGQNVFGRYVTEDLPYLLVPAVEMSRKVGLETPILKLTVDLASMLHDTDYFKVGNNLEKLGIANNSIEEIINMTKTL